MPQSTDADATVPESHKLGPSVAPRTTDGQGPMPDSPDPPSPPLSRGKNPLLYELAEVVRIVRERWTTESQEKSHESPKDGNSRMGKRRRFLYASRRFLYALAGTTTYILFLFLVRGSIPIHDITKGASSTGSASESISFDQIDNMLMWISVILALFFAFILSRVEKNRGPVALYLEGVTLPAITVLIIRYSLGFQVSS